MVHGRGGGGGQVSFKVDSPPCQMEFRRWAVVGIALHVNGTLSCFPTFSVYLTSLQVELLI